MFTIMLSSKKELKLKLEQDYNMHIITPTTAVMTSKNYVVGLGVCPDACFDQNALVTLVETMDLATGNVSVIEKKTMSEEAEFIGWFADKVGDYIFTEDLVNHSWHIYSHKGEQLKTGVHETDKGLFVYYDVRNQNVFFLALDSKGKYIVNKT